MLLWKQAVTDRTQSDVNRILELLEKGWQNFTEDEQSEWRAGMKGALNKSDLLRIQNNVAILNDVLELGLEVFNLGKNLIPFPYYDTTTQRCGVDVTTHADGCLIIDGKVTGTSTFWYSLISVSQNFWLQPGTYTLSGCPAGGAWTKYCLRITDADENSIAIDYGSGKTFTLTKRTKIKVFIWVRIDVEVEDLRFEPQLEMLDSASMFEKYSGRDINFPTKQMFNELLSNVSAIREAYCIHSDTPPVPSLPLNTYQKWNDIERILNDVHGILLNNFYYYSGNEIYAGDDTGLLL